MSIVAATPDAISEAAALLQSGALVAFPTETVYGLGADAMNGEAVAAISRPKAAAVQPIDCARGGYHGCAQAGVYS